VGVVAYDETSSPCGIWLESWKDGGAQPSNVGFVIGANCATLGRGALQDMPSKPDAGGAVEDEDDIPLIIDGWLASDREN
jgi:hypothetical protein